METLIKQLDGLKVELTITIEAEEVDKQIAEAYRKTSKTRIPGFRPGKAPRKILDNYFGGKAYFLTTATEELVQRSAARAVDEAGLVALEKPECTDSDIAQEGQPYTFVLTVKTTPHLELSSYDPVRIELPELEPTEEEIQQRIDSLREYYVEHEEVTDRGAQIDDELEIVVQEIEQKTKPDIADGIIEDEKEGKEETYLLGSNARPKQFEDGLMGIRAGETKVIEMVSGDESEEANNKSTVKTGAFKVTVNSVRTRNLPELTDAWVKNTIEYEGVDELRARIIESLKESKEVDMTPIRDMFASQQLAARLVGEPPEEMIKVTEQNNYQDFFKSLQDSRTTLDYYLKFKGITSEQFREQMHSQAVFNTTVALALDALARHLKISVTDEEVHAEFKKSGAEKPEELYKDWKLQGRLSEVREGLMRIKAADHLYDTAVIMKREEFEKAEAKKKETEAIPTTDAPVKRTRTRKAAVAEAPVQDAATETFSAENAPIEAAPVEAAPAEEAPAKKPAARKTAAKKTAASSEEAVQTHE